jgi:excisionase family DNA binding protein
MKVMAENKAQWVSIGEAAKYLGVSRDTLRRWEKRGKIKAIRSPTNRRYYTKKQLNEIMGTRQGAKKTPVKKLSVVANRLVVAAVLSSIAAVLIASAIVFGLIK